MWESESPKGLSVEQGLRIILDNPSDSDDSDYNPTEGTDSEDSDKSDLSSLADEENEEEVVVLDGWKLIPNFEKDNIPAENNFAQFVPEYKIHPIISEEILSAVDAVQLFIDENVAGKICEWTNTRAELYFHNKLDKKVYDIFYSRYL